LTRNLTAQLLYIAIGSLRYYLREKFHCQPHLPLRRPASLLQTPTLANRKLLVPLILGTLPFSRLCSVTTTGLITAAASFHTSPAVFRSPLINMAWRSSGGSNRDLIENMWRNQLITHPQVKEAFLKVTPFHPPLCLTHTQTN
jgi:hypothetical protein